MLIKKFSLFVISLFFILIGTNKVMTQNLRTPNPEFGKHIVKFSKSEIRSDLNEIILKFTQNDEGEYILNDEELQELKKMKIPFTVIGKQINIENFIKNQSFSKAYVSGENTSNVDIPDYDGSPGFAYSDFTISNAPSGAQITNVKYDVNVDHSFVNDLKLYIYNAAHQLLIWDRLGGTTDEGYDDDFMDDNDIDLDWRETSFFNGETPNQYWSLDAYDYASQDVGNIDWIKLKIYYAIQGDPDLIVEDMYIEPEPFEVNKDFDLHATIKNVGELESASTEIKYYIDGQYVDDDNISSLSPGETDNENDNNHQVSTSGWHTYTVEIIAVDGEQNTSNNTSTMDFYVPPSGSPDLIVEDMYIEPVPPVEINTDFDLHAMIKNVGDADAESTEIKYYIDGLYVDDDNISSLSPGETDDEYDNNHQVSTPGWHTYTVEVTAVNGEDNTSNNSSTIDFEAIDPNPNDPPTITMVLPSNSNVTEPEGTTINFEAEVFEPDGENDFDKVEWKVDGILEYTDTYSSIWWSNPHTSNFDYTFNTPGQYTVKAEVFDVSGLSNSLVWDIIITNTAPDLIVESMSIEPIPPVEINTDFDLHATIKNVGDADAESTEIKYYIDGLYVDDDNISSLSPGETDDEYDNNHQVSTPGWHTYTVEVTAVNGEDNTSNNSSTIDFEAIDPNPNDPPYVNNPISNQTYNEGFGSSSISLSSVFNDPDGDNLDYSATSSNTNVVSVSISGSVLYIYEQSSTGVSTIEVTAEDPDGETAEDVFTVTVETTNSSPYVSNPISNQTYNEGFGSSSISLSSVFNDPDGDNLDYSATSSNTNVVSISISGSALYIYEQSSTGVSTIEVTAEDPDGETAEDVFTVTVTPDQVPDINVSPQSLTIEEPVENKSFLNNGSELTEINIDDIEITNPDVEKAYRDSKGNIILGVKIDGKPPKKYDKSAALTDKDMMSSVQLEDVPAYNWSFGCSPTSAAMYAAYYDNLPGFGNVYTGPTNGGVMPMDNSTWPDVFINGENRHQCPLSATRNGLDGRTLRGHVDDYWIHSGNEDNDPYITNGWTEHEYGDCLADYMGTSQSENNLSDGGTWFYFYSDGSRRYNEDLSNVTYEDGCHGIREFFEARGYNVTDNYNQTIAGYEGNTNGFTYEQFKEEIDNGNPVIINVVGHTMLATGYNDSDNSIIIHNTWDYNDYSMQWGGSYEGMEHYMVSVIHLETVEQENSFTISNEGSGSLEITNINSEEQWLNETGFPSLPFTIDPGNIQDVMVDVDWSQLNTPSSGTITINSNDPDEGSVTVEVTAIPEEDPSEITLSLPDVTGAPGESVSIPVTLSNPQSEGIEGVNITVNYDPSVIDATGGTLSGGVLDGQNYGSNFNTSVSGEVSAVVYANSQLFEGEGEIMYLQFDVTGNQGDMTDLTFTQNQVNETTVAIENGSFEATSSQFDIQGNITYHNSNVAVPGANVNLAGDGSHTATTDNSGLYVFEAIEEGSYNLEATKSDDIGGLSATDASRIARYSVGLYEFNDFEMIAGDVSMNGSISATDASRVARYSVGLLEELNSNGQNWTFVSSLNNPGGWPPIDYESGYSYSPLDGDQSGQDLTGIRIGDVTANWSPGGQKAQPRPSLFQELAQVNAHVRLPIVVNQEGVKEGIDIRLNYDKSALHYEGATLAGGILSESNYSLRTNFTGGQGKMSIYAQDELISSRGIVAYVEFSVTGPVNGSEVYLTQFDVNENEAAGGFKLPGTKDSNREMTKGLKLIGTETLMLEARPNPFSSQVRISYELSSSTKVSLQILDQNGRRLQEIVKGYQMSGQQEVLWNAKAYSSGVYYCRIVTPTHSEVIKLVLMR